MIKKLNKMLKLMNCCSLIMAIRTWISVPKLHQRVTDKQMIRKLKRRSKQLDLKYKKMKLNWEKVRKKRKKANKRGLL